MKEDFPGCCMIDVLTPLDCITTDDEWSKQERDELAEDAGAPNSLTLAVASQENGVAVCEKQRSWLEEHGFKLVGSFPGMESSYRNFLYAKGLREVKNANSRNERSKRLLGKAKKRTDKCADHKPKAKRTLPW